MTRLKFSLLAPEPLGSELPPPSAVAAEVGGGGGDARGPGRPPEGAESPPAGEVVWPRAWPAGGGDGSGVGEGSRGVGEGNC